ncbi:hypothetical protein Q8F55_005689 [Vanrija albida]|uniref:Amino acid transporter transmembrane domain-containing protein n=1 Tax=Vanrija albida TaxID=181172 RepID=A0ABR3Q2K8_9TREE
MATTEKDQLRDVEYSAGAEHSSGKGNSYEVDVGPAAVHDAVFGDVGEDGPNFRAVGVLGSFILMTKANLGLGVLALPSVFGVLGLVPGILLIVLIQTIIAYSATVIGSFKLNHPEVYSLADAAFVFGGRPGWWTFYVVFTLFMVFIIGSALVGVSTSLNAVSTHGTCTAVFIAVAAIAGFLLGSIRTLGKISWIGWAGIVSIMAAIITLTVAVGVQDRPSEAPPAPAPWDKGVLIIAHPTFAQAMSAINGIVFSYGGTPMYFGIVSEMRDPRQFVKPMVLSIFFLTAVYLIIGSTVYHFCGQYVASPALGSAGPLLKKVCYGLAIPGLLASLTIFTHLCGKNLFVRILHGSPHLSKSTPTHWITWLLCTAGSVIVGYIIASAIPIFGSLIGFIGALICPNVCIVPYVFMWFHDNWRMVPADERTTRTKVMAGLNILLLTIGAFLTVAGTYGAVVDLINTTVDQKPWSCNDNSGSVKSS